MAIELPMKKKIKRNFPTIRERKKIKYNTKAFTTSITITKETIMVIPPKLL
jgi:hypothetical protein